MTGASEVALCILGGGAAKGMVASLRAAFEAAHGVAIDGRFNAVGAVRDRFVAGEPCDVLILTAALIDQLTRGGMLLAGSAAPIGAVRTAVAVPSGHDLPAIASGEALRDSLLAASGLYVPDTRRSTAGSHVRDVLRALGIEAAMAPRLREFPNGETAMRALAEERHTEGDTGGIGCTQATEIRHTPGLTLVGPLPPPHGLVTVYTAACSATTRQPELAHALVAWLTGPDARAACEQAGFECPAAAAADARR